VKRNFCRWKPIPSVYMNVYINVYSLSTIMLEDKGNFSSVKFVVLLGTTDVTFQNSYRYGYSRLTLKSLED
jgi:hypothetical protein